MVFQLFQPNSEKGSFSSFPSFLAFAASVDALPLTVEYQDLFLSYIALYFLYQAAFNTAFRCLGASL